MGVYLNNGFDENGQCLALATLTFAGPFSTYTLTRLCFC